MIDRPASGEADKLRFKAVYYLQSILLTPALAQVRKVTKQNVGLLDVPNEVRA